MNNKKKINFIVRNVIAIALIGLVLGPISLQAKLKPSLAYKLGCLKANTSNSIAVCMRWKKTRGNWYFKAEEWFQMGCRAQLLWENKLDVDKLISLCDNETKEMFK